MPYIIKKFKQGYKVCKKDNPKICFSNKYLTKEQAQAQMKAIIISELKRYGKLKGYGKGDKKYNLLELFKGTGSINKVFKKNFNIISLDNEEKFNPDLLINILDWDYKTFVKNMNFIPNVIWASPPCNTYSVLAYKFQERNTKTGEPYSERAKEGTKILYKTLKIIKYFQKLNPNLIFIIENPVGMMREDKKIKKLIRNTTKYCLYGDKRRKPTDFFSNIDLDLKDPKLICEGDFLDIQYIPVCERYKIPPKLVKQIEKVCLEHLEK